ncbi:unnamed protein product [Sphenostylis stenocarpa]|uniref:Uncharacterized protein n=1 Tax=Sphenostylis stenocarpa TaxID=92480 RepID=A0AA86S8C5_9FABA|nr:unnamed protein product [Sphenostylis stenocarpa]
MFLKLLEQAEKVFGSNNGVKAAYFKQSVKEEVEEEKVEKSRSTIGAAVVAGCEEEEDYQRWRWQWNRD